MNQLNIKEIIGNIEKRIDDHRFVNARITSEINILSLNATIEAARAGDAGKGWITDCALSRHPIIKEDLLRSHFNIKDANEAIT